MDEGLAVSSPRWTAAVVLAALVAVYWDLFGRMAHVWWNHEYAGHGMFVPLFSAVIAIGDRDRLSKFAERGSWRGLAVIALGLGLLRAGAALGSLLLEGLSVPVVVGGLVLLAFGARTLVRAAFPVAFLGLMVPLPQAVAEAVTIHLQVFATNVAGLVLRLFDIPFLRDGVVIELAGVTLQVAEACNGLRFLIGLVVLTLAFAQITQDRLWQKLALAGAAVPMAVMANAVRVAGISTAAHFYGPEALGSPHLLIGKVVWIGTIGGLVALGLGLRRLGA